MIGSCTPCPPNNRLERAGSTLAAQPERSAKEQQYDERYATSRS
jgi:hypothetical protein